MSEFLSLDIEIGGRGRKRMPASEVCLHMRVYDQYFDFEIVGDEYPMVQLFVTDDETPRFTQMFSMPITLGEAGIYREGERLYFYPHEYRDKQERSDPVAAEVFEPVRAAA